MNDPFGSWNPATSASDDPARWGQLLALIESDELDSNSLPNTEVQLNQDDGASNDAPTYRRGRLIGSGGMGLVYEAERITTAEGSPLAAKTESVAIKILRPELTSNPKAVRHFLREVRFQSNMDHPGILPVLDVGDDEKEPWFSMPLMREGSLADRLAREGILPDADISRIAGGVARALDYAQRTKGILHRDIKPANVLLDSEGAPVIMDFGLARQIDSDSIHEFQPSHKLGTAAYMSPQIAKGDADLQCDVYAFGALIYEMLVGRPPYQGDTSESILEQIRKASSPPISEVNPAAPKHWVNVAEGCLARPSVDRYPSMSAILEDIERIERGESPTGRIPVHRSNRSWVSTSFLILPLLAIIAALIAGKDSPNPIPTKVIDQPSDSTRVQPRGSTLRIELASGPIRHPDVPHWGPGRISDSRADGPKRTYVPNRLRDKILIFSHTGELVDSFPIGADGGTNINLTTLKDIGGDPREEVIVNWLSEGQAMLRVFSPTGTPGKQFQFQGSDTFLPDSSPYWSHLKAHDIFDIEPDGHTDLIATINSGEELTPRGVCIFDFTSGKLTWSFSTRGWAYQVRTMDISPADELDLVFVTAAVNNEGKPDDPHSDAHSWIFCVGHDNQRIWSRQLGDEYTYPRFLDKSPPRDSPIILSLAGAKHARAKVGKSSIGKMLAIGLDGTIATNLDVEAYIEDMIRFEDDILITDENGTMHRVDKELKRIKSETPLREFKEAKIWQQNPNGAKIIASFLGVEDLNNDGRTEVVLSVYRQDAEKRQHECDLVILNSEMKEITRRRFQEISKSTNGFVAELHDMDGDGRKEIVIRNESLSIYRIE